jgi:hypothetical protein
MMMLKESCSEKQFSPSVTTLQFGLANAVAIVAQHTI